jgi:hypothetical protein
MTLMKIPHLAILHAACGFVMAVCLVLLYLNALLQLFAWLAR